MIKVFLAEDEFVVREGIKNNIDWAGNGCEFCGEAADGEIAWALIRKLQPDIVITDIKMPFMDGLTLSRLIREEFPNIEIILLTGYEEFEYAQEAIRIGVARYLSKPISGENLIREVRMLSEKIQERKKPAPAESGIRLEEVDPKQADTQKIMEFLRRGDSSETDDFVDDVFDSTGSGATKSLMFRQYVVMNIYFSAADFIENELSLAREEAEPPDPGAGIASNVESAKDYARRVLGHAIALRDEASGDRYRDVVRLAIDYIEDHYADEELSLNTLAAHVSFSPNHLSAVFRQETGQSFIKYLTDRRMTEAKRLLKCTGRKSSEIGPLVGYKDPHYFSYIFKKTQGVTPTQYRDGSGEEE